MNVLQVLLITTILYFIGIAVWVMKMEDIIEAASERRAGSGGGR